MRAFISISVLLVCLGMSTQTAYAGAPFALVELFSSEGCSSCPPADDVLRAINKKAADEHLRIFALSFQVDYWNSLGWVDPYSKKAFTARQWEYAKKKNEASVYTPQMVVNGNQLFNGAIEELAFQYIDQYLQMPAANSIRFAIKNQDSRIQVDYELESPAKGMLINFVIIEKGLESHVTAGENSGRDLRHDNIVRQFQTVTVSQQTGSVFLNHPDAGDMRHMSIIGYLQDPQSMKILAAEKMDLSVIQ